MQIHMLLLVGILAAPGQAPGRASSLSTDCLTPLEKSRLQTELKLDNRIKIYSQGCERCIRSLSDLIQQQQPQLVPVLLQSWAEMLDASLKDIQASPGRKDRSRALLKYEIRLRQAIGAVQESSIRAGAGQQDHFERWMAQAEVIRKKLVAMLFPK